MLDIDIKHSTVSEELYSNQFIFVMNGILICFSESLRLLSILRIGNNPIDIIIAFISNIISEILSQNNLNYKFLYLILNKIGNILNNQTLSNMKNPDLTRVYSVYYGAKYNIEYVPLIIVLLYNLFDYGPSNSCTILSPIPENINLSNTQDSFGYWMILIVFLMEFVGDAASQMTRNFLINWNVVGRKDPKHRIIYVTLTFEEIVVVGLCVAQWCHWAMYFDCISLDTCQ